jgi:hypothetical protein
MRKAAVGMALVAVLVVLLGAAFGPPAAGDGSLIARATEAIASVLVLVLFGLVLASIAGMDWRKRL